MKKSLIATAVAAGLLATGAAQAQPKVYGLLHLAINVYNDNHWSDDPTDTTIIGTPDAAVLLERDSARMESQTSAIGVKGSEDLGGGLKAIYKAEFKMDPFNSSRSIERRDIWLGLKGGWGKLAAGTMSSNYKQMGGKIDPLYRTEAEGRGRLNMQSKYHGGAGINGGRMERTLQYTTPKMAGIELVFNTTLFGVDSGCQTSAPAQPPAGTIGGPGGCDETVGLGARWSNKNWLLYLDYLDPNEVGRGAAIGSPANPSDESIVKLGGKWSNDQFQVSLQYEGTEDQLGGDYLFTNGLWNINKKNTVTLSYGQQDKVSKSFALAYVFKMSKMSNVYAAYGQIDEDSAGSAASRVGFKDDGTIHDKGSVLSLGIRKSF